MTAHAALQRHTNEHLALLVIKGRPRLLPSPPGQGAPSGEGRSANVDVLTHIFNQKARGSSDRTGAARSAGVAPAAAKHPAAAAAGDPSRLA